MLFADDEKNRNLFNVELKITAPKTHNNLYTRLDFSFGNEFGG